MKLLKQPVQDVGTPNGLTTALTRPSMPPVPPSPGARFSPTQAERRWINDLGRREAEMRAEWGVLWKDIAERIAVDLDKSDLALQMQGQNLVIVETAKAPTR